MRTRDREAVSMTLPKGLIDRLDAFRGDVPRSVTLQRMIEHVLEENGAGENK
jgi:metal-responsive CopG/Arc/MetJ family transcriptional regulator